MSIGEFCNREVVVITRDETVLEAARLMRRFHVGDVVVVAQQDGVNVPLGILTDRDIVIELVAAQVDPQDVSVGDAMSEQLLVVSETAGLLDTLGEMRRMGVRRVPVVGSRGELVGILTLDDVLDVLAEAFSDVVLLTGREQRRERETRA